MHREKLVDPITYRKMQHRHARLIVKKRRIIVKITNKNRCICLNLIAFFLLMFVAGAHSALAQTVIPVNGVTPTLLPVTINTSPGDQFDPHVSGDWVAYTSDLGIRYYNFVTGID